MATVKGSSDSSAEGASGRKGRQEASDVDLNKVVPGGVKITHVSDGAETNQSAPHAPAPNAPTKDTSAKNKANDAAIRENAQNNKRVSTINKTLSGKLSDSQKALKQSLSDTVDNTERDLAPSFYEEGNTAVRNSTNSQGETTPVEIDTESGVIVGPGKAAPQRPSNTKKMALKKGKPTPGQATPVDTYKPLSREQEAAVKQAAADYYAKQNGDTRTAQEINRDMLYEALEESGMNAPRPPRPPRPPHNQNTTQNNNVPINNVPPVSYRQARKEPTERELIDEFFNKYPKNLKAVSKEFPQRNAPLSSKYETLRERGQRKQGKLRTAPDPKLDDIEQTAPERLKQDRLIDRVTREIILGYFHVEGERYNKKTHTVQWTRPIEDAIGELQEYFNIPTYDTRTIFRLVRLYASMSTDRNAKMFLEDADKWSMSESDFIKICKMIHRSCIEKGHPLGIIEGNVLELGGTVCFPSGVMPKAIATKICNQGSNLRCSPAELVQRCQNEWTTTTYPLIRYALTGEKKSQRIVIEDMQRGIAALDGISSDRFSERFDISNTIDYKLTEFEDDIAAYATATYDKYDAKAVAEDQRRKSEQAKKRLDKRRNGTQKYDDGEYHRNKNKENSFISGLNLVTSLMKINGVVLNPALITAAVMEHGVGNVTSKMTIWTMRNTDANVKDFTLDDWTLDQFKSDEGVEAICALKILFDVGGADAVRVYRTEFKGKPLNQDMAVKFLNEYVVKEQNPGIKSARDKLEKITRKLLVGDYAFKKSDALLWANGFMTYQQWNAVNQLNYQVEHKPGYTADEVKSMIKAEGIEHFLANAAGTDAGINAYQMMRANNIAQVTPLSYLVDRFLRDHGVTNFAVTSFVDTYLMYGVNYIQSFIPFSKTMSYLSVKGIQSTGRGENIGDYQLGGNMDFIGGLRMNLFYDFGRLGQIGLCGLLIYTVIKALGGLQEPDDPNNIYNISMWKIGTEEDNVEIQYAWWLNDLLLFGLPAALAMLAKEKTNDSILARELFLDGCHDMLSGNALLDIVDMVGNCRDDLLEFEKMTSEPGYDGPKDKWSFALKQLELMGAKASGKLIPSIFNNFHRDTLFMGTDAYAKNYGKVFDKSSEWAIENGITKSVSWDEYLDRKYSYSNLLYALFNNIFKNHGDEKKTGYFWWEMPDATMSDTEALAWAGRYAMDYSNIPEGFTYDTYREAMTDMIIADIDGFDNIEQAKDLGYIIPTEAREAALDVLYSRIGVIESEYAAKLRSGELSRYVDRQPAYEAYTKEKNKLNTYIWDWLRNNDIPEWSDGYKKLLTDTEISYAWKDTHEPAPASEMFNPMVEPVFINKGNHPTSILPVPFTVVDTKDRGYNGETLPYWLDQGTTGTDIDKLFEINQTLGPLTMGRNEGEFVNDVIFGGNGNGDYTHKNQPTIGQRSYIYEKKPLSDTIANFKQEDASGSVYGEAGKYNQEVQDIINGKSKSSTSKTPTYYKRSTYGYKTGGSGGSNYNPKIYSNSKYLNSPKAATMYSKTPSTARESYLRPSFSTKGSREAYRRQDI